MPKTSWIVLASLGLLAVGSCSDDGASSVELGVVIRVNDASEEVLALMAEAVGEGRGTVDDAKTPALTSPADGASVPADPVPTFSWAKPAGVRHGTNTGDFVWMKLSGGGLAKDIDMIAVGVDAWTPLASDWDLIRVATGPITVTMTSAYLMTEVIKDGPYTRTTTTEFTVAH